MVMRAASRCVARDHTPFLRPLPSGGRPEKVPLLVGATGCVWQPVSARAVRSARKGKGAISAFKAVRTRAPAPTLGQPPCRRSRMSTAVLSACDFEEPDGGARLARG